MQIAVLAASAAPPPDLYLRVRKPHAQSGTALCFVLFCLMLIDTGVMAASETIFRGAITSTTAAVILLPLIVRMLKRPIDIFEPIIPTTLAFLSMFVLRPVLDQVSSNYVHLGFNFSADFDETLLVVLAGCSAFAAGYISNCGVLLQRFLPRPRPDFPIKQVEIAALVTAAVGITLFAGFIVQSGGMRTLALLLRGRSGELDHVYRNSTGYLYGGVTLVIPASFMFFGAWLRSRRKFHLILAISVLGPSLVIGIAQGTRISLLPVVTGLAAIYYIYKQRRPKLRNLFVAGLVALTISSFLREVRDFDKSGKKAAAWSELMRDPGKTLADTFSNDDNEMFDTLANSLSVFPRRVPFQPFALVTDFVNRIIPRTLYPNKPLEVNDQFIVALWPQHYAYSRASSSSSIFGNFFLYGGAIGVAVGGFAIGVVLNQLWQWQLRNSRNLNVLLLYAFVPSLVLILMRGTVIDTLSKLCYSVVPLIIAQRYWRRA